MKVVTLCCEKCGHLQKQTIPAENQQTAVGMWEANAPILQPVPSAPPCGDMGVTAGGDDEC